MLLSHIFPVVHPAVTILLLYCIGSQPDLAPDRISRSDHNFDICASVFTEIVFTQSLSAGNINVPMNLIKLLRYSLTGICLWLGVVRQ